MNLKHITIHTGVMSGELEWRYGRPTEVRRFVIEGTSIHRETIDRPDLVALALKMVDALRELSIARCVGGGRLGLLDDCEIDLNLVTFELRATYHQTPLDGTDSVVHSFGQKSLDYLAMSAGPNIRGVWQDVT